MAQRVGPARQECGDLTARAVSIIARRGAGVDGDIAAAADGGAVHGRLRHRARRAGHLAAAYTAGDPRTEFHRGHDQPAVGPSGAASMRGVDIAGAAYDKAGVTARIEPFIDDMAAAYAWADLVLCRAGALTVAELAAAGVGAVLVPYPHAVDDHQSHNAQYLVQADAALIVQERELTAARLADLLAPLCDETARPRLTAMAQAARRLAHTDAAARVAEQCLEVARG